MVQTDQDEQAALLAQENDLLARQCAQLQAEVAGLLTSFEASQRECSELRGELARV